MMAHSAIASVSIAFFVEKEEMAIMLDGLEMFSKVLRLPDLVCIVLSFFMALDSYDSSEEDNH